MLDDDTTAAPEAAEAAAEEQAPVEPSTDEVPDETPAHEEVDAEAPADAEADEEAPADEPEPEPAPTRPSPVAVLFQAPEVTTVPRRARRPEPDEELDEDDEPRGRAADTRGRADDDADDRDRDDQDRDEQDRDDQDRDDEGGNGDGAARRRRRRGGRRRRKPSEGGEGSDDDNDNDEPEAETSRQQQGGGQRQQQGKQQPRQQGKQSDEREDDDSEDGEGGTRRRRRRVRAGEQSGGSEDDPQNTVTRVRKGRSPEDEITSVQGSTRLEAKKQRRREGREAGRRRAPIVSEAEFLARRESVDRTMVIRQRDDLTQIAVLEDKVLVEHYVARESQTSLIGNVYLGRVQNVLPSMEAAFIDIGKGRNAVLYAGEVNWQALGHKDGQPRKIESVLSSGQPILVQVSKDPIGHKGARLTSQVSLAGRFLVYVPDGTTSGISRKLPDTERNRLKTLLKEIVPDTAGVIVRTAAEGASEEELTRDVERLKARWEDIEAKAKSGNAPQLLYGEPDLTLKVVRDLFTEDFSRLVIQGDDAWETVQQYVDHVAPDLAERLERYDDAESGDVFSAYRIDEQIAKGLDRKVWLPSGGSLIIDRTEAMTVVDVNTGKFTGSGGNLEETVTKNNLEAAEEMVRQLRLRDIGGIIVIDFIDMVLESNRDLVLRRLVECLGRDRTRHQVAEVTSLGLVQMTRKRIGTGLLEAFTTPCEHCNGNGYHTHDVPVEPKKGDDGDRRSRRNRRGGGGGQGGGNGNGNGGGQQPKQSGPPTPKDVAAMAKPENAEQAAEKQADKPAGEPAAQVDEQSGPTEKPAARKRKSGGGRSQQQRDAEKTEKAEKSEEQQAGEQAAEAPAEAPAPVVAPPSEPAVADVPAPEPVADEKPATRVVTRTRRAASRPAGSTAGAVSLEPVAIVVPEAPAAETAPAAPAEAPKVVTRTRRVASRPAGSAAAAEEAPRQEAPSEEEQPAVEHVPVKKKGARKH
jgi:ribonuclease E